MLFFKCEPVMGARIPFLLATVLFFSSCFHPDANNPDLVIFENGFESIQGWTATPTPFLSCGNAHEGRYKMSVPPDSACSLFKATFGEISLQPMRVLRFSAWFLSDELPANGKLIFEIMSDTAHLMVNAYKVDKVLVDKDNWVEMRGHIDLFWKDMNRAANSFIVSFVNYGKREILLDDIRMEFTLD